MSSSSSHSMVVAIDGPAASGKGTLARKLAEDLDLGYLDTGKLYRAVAWELMQEGDADSVDQSKAAQIAMNLDEASVFNSHLYDENVGRIASIVSSMPPVRQALLDFQRVFANRPGGAVLDGRDIGTVVCPEAKFKFFITADIQSRARRRYDELVSKGENVVFEDILEHLRVRDQRDSGRAIAPLVQADDAIFIDTTDMGPEAVYNKVLSYIHQ